MSPVAPSSLLDTASKVFFLLTWLQVVHVSGQGFRECAGWQAGMYTRSRQAAFRCHAVSKSPKERGDGVRGQERTG